MATFSENSNWIDVTKPFNTDYHIAEKTNILFSSDHPFFVGDYLTETSSGATGILYELVSLTEINVARDSSTLFPATGELSNGTETFSYNSSSVTHGIDNDVSQRLVDRTKWLYDNKAAKSITIGVGTGLTGGGDLSVNRTISLGTPSQITSSSTNASSGTTHTHAIDQANTTRKGIVQLNNTLTSGSIDEALTAGQGKILQDTKAAKTTLMTAGTGLTGGGDLSVNRTISLGTPSSITSGTTNTVSGTTHTHAIAIASTSGAGLVQLNDTLTSTSTSLALTAAQGKVLQDSKAWNGITINAGTGLIGGGNLTTHRTISLGTPSTCNVDTTNIVSGATHTHYLERATEFRHGIARFATATEYLAGNYGVALDPHNFLQHSSRNGNGYQRLPGGLIIQWGKTASAVFGSHTLNFPITFTNTCLFAIACKNVTVDNYAGHVSTFTSTQLTLYVAVNAAYMFWLAIGY